MISLGRPPKIGTEYIPGVSPSDRKITLLPSGEISGWRSFAGSDVRRRGSPPEMCCTQISRFPSPARSDAYTTNLPSWEITGSDVSPESRVSWIGGDAVNSGSRPRMKKIETRITTAKPPIARARDAFATAEPDADEQHFGRRNQNSSFSPNESVRPGPELVTAP